MKIKPIVTGLLAFGERQGTQAKKAGVYLANALRAGGVDYTIEYVDTFLPKASSLLRIDGKLIPSAPTSFVGGKIGSAEKLVSSLIPTRYLIEVPNINFNPRSRALSRPNFYFAPSLAVHAQNVSKIIGAKKIAGTVRVVKERFSLPQLLVGNTKNPENIVFCHYDSIGPGAIDNASGTAVCLATALTRPELLKTTLFVFDPNEELSYDKPAYWGHGYRAFEARHSKLLKSCKKILVVDCVGNGKPQIIRDPSILYLAFPLKNITPLLKKTATLGGDIDKMMEVYQSDKDLANMVSEKSLQDAAAMLVSFLTKQ